MNEKDQLFERHEQLKLTQGEIDNLNKPKSFKEIETTITFLKRKHHVVEFDLGKSTTHLRNAINSPKSLSENESRSTTP